MNEPTPYGYNPDGIPFDEIVVSTLNRVFLLMFAGLGVTALAAFAAVTVPAIYMTIFSSPAIIYGLIFGELGLVIAMTAGMRKMSSATATALFYVYALINGLTLSVLFVVYEITSIYAAFGVTAIMFGIMSLIGATTKKDLTRMGSLLLMGLVGIILAAVVNLFLRNSLLDMAVSALGVLIFIGLTAYDTQRIKRNLETAVRNGEEGGELIRKISIYGALSLYLDFINLFLKLLRLFGKRK